MQGQVGYKWNLRIVLLAVLTESIPASDGMSDGPRIAELFASKYNDLYNSVSYNRNDLEDIREDVESLIHDNGMNDECVISSIDVSNAILCLKPHKNDGNSEFELSTDHFIKQESNYQSILVSCFLLSFHTVQYLLTSLQAPFCLFLKSSMSVQLPVIISVV